MTTTKRKAIIRYDSNPFLDKQITTIKTKKSWVKIGSGDHCLVDNQTGECTATNVVAVKEVDDSMFIKLFTQNIGLMVGLKAQGVKALSFLLWAVQKYAMRKDLVELDNFTRQDFVMDNEITFSERTMYQGLSQLEQAKIIAKAQKVGFYYINPNFIFNGDRIRFVSEIRRKKCVENVENN